MQKSNEVVVATQPSPKTERLPLQKRKKTISDDTHFPGPLFPAVRRNDRPSDLRVFIDSDASSSNSSITPTSSNGTSNGSNFSISSFNDRDWMYPSFLGPHMVRNRVKVKANKSQKHESKVAGEKQRVQELGSKKKEEEEEEEVKKDAGPVCSDGVLVSQSSSVSQSGSKTRGIKCSWMSVLVSN